MNGAADPWSLPGLVVQRPRQRGGRITTGHLCTSGSATASPCGVSEQPEPGLPWRKSAGLPSGLPQHPVYPVAVADIEHSTVVRAQSGGNGPDIWAIASIAAASTAHTSPAVRQNFGHSGERVVLRHIRNWQELPRCPHRRSADIRGSRRTQRYLPSLRGPPPPHPNPRAKIRRRGV